MSEEARKNLLALAIAFGVVALVVAFALRPGVVLPTTERALGSSLAGELGGESRSRGCASTSRDDVYECHAAALGYLTEDPSTHGGHFRVEVKWDGCWDAYRRANPPAESSPALAGCISILDY